MEILLFVNDNILIRSSIENFLISVGYSIDSCSDGLEGLNKFKNNKYDLVLLDMNLPSISGMDLIRSIREENGRIPILVFCTMEIDCNTLLPYVQGIFTQDTDEKELAEKIRKEIDKYNKRTDATG